MVDLHSIRKSCVCICLHGHVQHTCTCTCVLYCKQLPRECCSEHCSYAYHYDNCLNKTFTLLVHVYTIHIPMKFVFSLHLLSLHMTCVCVVSLIPFRERGKERPGDYWEQGCSMPYDVCTMYMCVVSLSREWERKAGMGTTACAYVAWE